MNFVSNLADDLFNDLFLIVKKNYFTNGWGESNFFPNKEGGKSVQLQCQYGTKIGTFAYKFENEGVSFFLEVKIKIFYIDQAKLLSYVKFSKKFELSRNYFPNGYDPNLIINSIDELKNGALLMHKNQITDSAFVVSNLPTMIVDSKKKRASKAI